MFNRRRPSAPSMPFNASAPAPLFLRDRYGREVTEGCEVTLQGMEIKGPTCIVQSIRPNMAPNAQPNTLLLTLGLQTTLQVPANFPVGNLIRILTVAELRALQGLPAEGAEERAPVSDASGQGPDAGEPALDEGTADGGGGVG